MNIRYSFFDFLQFFWFLTNFFIFTFIVPRVQKARLAHAYIWYQTDKCRSCDTHSARAWHTLTSNTRPTSVEKLKALNLGDLIFILFNRGSNFLLILKGKEILVSFNDTPPHRVYVILRGSRGNFTRITNDNQNIHE